MFVSKGQIRKSLDILKTLHPFFGMAFLAFKRSRIPIGETIAFKYSMIRKNILIPFYKPAGQYNGFYNPLKTSDPSNRWVSPRYESTSLQRIIADTFGSAFLHVKNTHQWGWRPNYVEILDNLRREQHSSKIPVFALATWLYREKRWPSGTKPEDIVRKFIDDFLLTNEEMENLCELSVESAGTSWNTKSQIYESSLLDIIGWPPGAGGDEGAGLLWLELIDVGPAKKFRYEAAERLNIITGDNSLGKDFSVGIHMVGAYQSLGRI